MAVATAWVSWSWDAPKLHAQGSAQDDADADGLPDGLELVLGTRVDLADTDGDGWSDAEEVARRSNPRYALSMPDTIGLPRLSVAMDAYLDGGSVHAITAVYLPDGDRNGRSARYATIVNGSIVPVPLSALRGGAPLRTVASRDGLGSILVLDPVVSAAWVLAANGMSLSVSVVDRCVTQAADAINLVVVDGEIFEHIVTGYASVVPDPEMTTGLGIGGVYRPIGSGGGPNANYTTGEICAQTTMVVGVVGALVTQEVVAADCVAGWDAHCSAGCSATVGSTIKTIDPAALVGG